MAVVRSPNYPAISFPECIAKARAIYEKEHNHAAPREVMVKAMGYSGINGSSSTMFSALTKFGLLENAGNEQYKISDEAMDIFLYERGQPDRRKAIEKLAFLPSLFTELRELYGKSLPSDDNLRAYLIKRGFNPKSVGDAIRAYRDTAELVEDETEGYNPSSEQSNLREEKPNMFQQQQSNAQINNASPPMNQTNTDLLDGDSVLSFNLSRSSQARVIFNGQVTQEAIRKLRTLLEVTEDTYPTQAELEQPKQATWRNKDFDAPVNVTGEIGEKDGKKFYGVEGSNTGISEAELHFGDGH